MVREFVALWFGISLSRSSCLNYLHRLGFAFKRPKKRLLKADEAKRESFVAEYAALMEEACQSNAKIFFADEAHFRADAELRASGCRGESRHWWTPPARGTEKRPATIRRCAWRRGRWSGRMLRQSPSLPDCAWTPPCTHRRQPVKAQQEGNSNSETSAAFLEQLRERHSGRLNVIWDNAPAHRGEAVREYIRTPGLNLRLVNLPGYSPDFNADEAIWGWTREETTGNLCLGTSEAVHERVSSFLAGLTNRKDEVRRRWLPDRPAIKGRKAISGLPAPSPTPGKCTSHLVFSLVRRQAFGVAPNPLSENVTRSRRHIL